MAKLNNTKKSGKNVADDKERLASEIAARYDPNSATYKYPLSVLAGEKRNIHYPPHI